MQITAAGERKNIIERKGDGINMAKYSQLVNVNKECRFSLFNSHNLTIVCKFFKIENFLKIKKKALFTDNF